MRNPRSVRFRPFLFLFLCAFWSFLEASTGSLVMAIMTLNSMLTLSMQNFVLKVQFIISTAI